MKGHWYSNKMHKKGTFDTSTLQAAMGTNWDIRIANIFILQVYFKHCCLVDTVYTFLHYI